MRDAPRHSPTRPLLRVLPGRLFFAESVPCPATLPGDGIAALSRLTIETHSPFPEEKLSVSRIHDRTREKLLVLAALHERLAAFHDSENPKHLIADAAAPLPPGEDGWIWMLTDRAMTAVRRENGTVVAIRGFGPPITPEAATEHRSALAAEARLPVTGPLWSLTGVSAAGRSGGIEFRWRDMDSGNEAATSLSEADLLAADVRPPETLAVLRGLEKAERRLKILTRLVASAACLLLLAQIGLWAAQGVAGHRETLLDDNRPKAETAEANAAMLDTWSRVTDRRPPLLERLAALNEPRPDAVWLRRVAFDDKTLTATGQARSMESLNGWLADLKRSKDFSAIATPRISASGQGVSFELHATPAKAASRSPR